MIFEGVRQIEAPLKATWHVIADPARFLSSLAVISDVRNTPSGHIAAKCVLPLGFGDLHLDTTVRLVIDTKAGYSARYMGTARGDGVHVSFDNSVRVAAASQSGETILSWNAAVILRGPIVGMVQHVAPILVGRQVDAAYEALVAHLDAG